ncbi:hypothetical protein [Bartonella sp. CL100XZDX]
MQEGWGWMPEGVVHVGVSCWDACVEGVGLLPKSLLFIEFF